MLYRVSVLLLGLLLGACAMVETHIPTPNMPETEPPLPPPVIALPSVQTILEQAPQLIAPPAHEYQSLNRPIKLAWSWERPLQPDEVYEIRIAQKGRTLQRLALTTATVYDATDWLMQSGGGEYYWRVRVIALRQDNTQERRISMETPPLPLWVRED